jgi:predicted nucleotidyltransferase
MEKQGVLANSEIQAVKDIILKTVDCEKIFLFGSFAYGTPQNNSDYDIYVVLNNESQNTVIAEQCIYRNLSRHEGSYVPIDILVENKNKFYDLCVLPTIERKIMREGILLYDNTVITPSNRLKNR